MILTFEGGKKTRRMPSNLQTPQKIVRSHPGTLKKLRTISVSMTVYLRPDVFFFFSHQLLCPHTHTHARRHARNIQKRTSVITALPVAASSFPQRVKKKKKKRKKKKRRERSGVFLRDPGGFSCTVGGGKRVRSLANKRLDDAVRVTGQSLRSQSQFINNLPLLLGLSLSSRCTNPPLIIRLYTL